MKTNALTLMTEIAQATPSGWDNVQELVVLLSEDRDDLEEVTLDEVIEGLRNLRDNGYKVTPMRMVEFEGELSTGHVFLCGPTEDDPTDFEPVSMRVIGLFSTIDLGGK